MYNWYDGDAHLEVHPQRGGRLHAAALGEALREAGRALARAIAGVAARAAQARRAVADDVARRRIYRTTARELALLDDRTLADLGVHRGEIRWIAEEMARSGGVTQTVRQLRAAAAEERARPPAPPHSHQMLHLSAPGLATARAKN